MRRLFFHVHERAALVGAHDDPRGDGLQDMRRQCGEVGVSAERRERIHYPLDLRLYSGPARCCGARIQT